MKRGALSLHWEGWNGSGPRVNSKPAEGRVKYPSFSSAMRFEMQPYSTGLSFWSLSLVP